MGFRSTFVSEDIVMVWPDWFREKWGQWVNIESCLSSKYEAKLYGTGDGFVEDVQKALAERKPQRKFRIVFLHECGGASRCTITATSIDWAEPDAWHSTEGVEHMYCYGCSEANQ